MGETNVLGPTVEALVLEAGFIDLVISYLCVVVRLLVNVKASDNLIFLLCG